MNSIGLQGHRLLAPPVGVVLPAEPDLAVLQGDQPVVADRHPVGVPGQVLQHLLRSAEGRLGVHDPLGLGAGGEPALELAGVGQRGELAVEGEPSPVEGGAEQRQELAPEDAAEHAHRQEESRPAGDPARAVGRQPTPRHDAVHMRVVLEVLAPGVEDGQEADLGPEVLRDRRRSAAGSRRRPGTGGRRPPAGSAGRSGRAPPGA